MSSTKTALLIMDMQNENLAEGGRLLVPELLEHVRKQRTVEHVAELAAAARAAGVPVIHIHHVENPGHEGTITNISLFQDVVAADALIRGTWGAEGYGPVAPVEDDIVVEKNRMNAFYNSALQETLDGLGAQRLILTGIFTSFVVEHTARHAADAGFDVVVVSDGTATMNDEWQHASLDTALTKIARKATTAELVAELA